MMRSSWMWLILSIIITGTSLLLTIRFKMPFLLFFLLFPPIIFGRKTKQVIIENQAQFCPNCGYRYQGFEKYCPICGAEREE